MSVLVEQQDETINVIETTAAQVEKWNGAHIVDNDKHDHKEETSSSDEEGV